MEASGRSAPRPGHARRIASGSLLQQASQLTGLLAMLAVVTVLARRLPLNEFGLYGLLASLAGYLLVVQNAAAGGVVRQLAIASEDAARTRAWSSAIALYAAAGLVAGAALAAAGVALSAGLDLPAEVRYQGRLGSLLLGAATAAGWPLTILRDGLRARQLFVRLAAAEMAGVVAFAALLLGLAFAGTALAALIAASGTLPALVGASAWAAGRGAPAGFRWRVAAVDRAEARSLLALGGWLSLTEAAAAAVYALDRVILGVLKSASTVGLFEGPVRAHNLVRALNAAVATTTLPAASRFAAEGDTARQRELLVRGLRYSLALVVPPTVTGMVLAPPILEVWLGEGFREGGTAMAILFGYWLAYGASGVVSAVLVALGRARRVALYASGVVAANLVLALALVPPLGLEGVAIATTAPYLAVSLLLVRLATAATATAPRLLLRECFLPAWTLGASLALVLAAARVWLDPESLGAVLALGVAGPALFWLAYYGLWMSSGERRLVRDLGRLRRGGPAAAGR